MLCCDLGFMSADRRACPRMAGAVLCAHDRGIRRGSGTLRLLWGIAVFVPSVIGALAVLALTARAYLHVARRRRWRGEVYPASSTVPRRTPHTMRIRVSPADAVAAVARWGAADQLSTVRVRASGQLRWHPATVFVLEDGAGMIIDPLWSLRRRYVFDGSCVVEPSNAVMTFQVNSSSAHPRVYHPVRVGDAERSMDLAVDTADLPKVMGVGRGPASAGEGDVHSPRRRKLVEVGDRFTVYRRALAAMIGRESRARRSVGAACSAGCMAAIAAVTWVSDVADSHHVQFLHPITDLDFPLGISALVFAFRALRPRRPAARRRFGSRRKRAAESWLD